jgi:hexosaminidase
MKKITLAAFLALAGSALMSQPKTQPTISIIPEPVSVIQGTGNFTLLPNPAIIVQGNDEVKKIAEQLASTISQVTGFHPSINPGSTATPKSIFLSLTADKTITTEGYRLKVSPESVTITAADPAGIFYGVQTLYQLFPKQIYSKTRQSAAWTVPSVTIEDHPRFGWRGLMLDVSRHFFTKDQVKEYIDEMARYKYNLLHLHLTDDQGWRIEIKSLPKLTEVGAWRVDKTGTFGRFSPPLPNEPKTYGGFYTQEDIKELVRYAKERFINIMPEIDVPGHSLAAIASYPELTSTPGTYAVNSGEQLMVWPGGGQHFYGLIDNSLCPAKENVYTFLDKVFTELAQLFPFEYIHMGGDETARNFWEKSEDIKALMKKENLKDLNEVQSYFVKRVEKIINSKGKKLIGWDEILEGGLAPNAAVMSWRGMKGGVEAVKQGHEVVMSPTDFAYLDYMQGDAALEPPVYATLRLKKAYEFEPVPEGANPALIKGGQANLWSEQIYNMRHLQYMMWPRGIAIAEALWTPREKKNWNNFAKRVETEFERLDIAEIKYSPALYDPIVEVSKKDTSTIMVKLSTEIEGLSIHYSFDNSFPDEFYPKYSSPLAVPKDASEMKIITSRNNKLIGRLITIPIEELRKRAGIK